MARRKANMQVIEANIKRIIREVARDKKLPLEEEKEEILVLHLRKSRKKKKVDRRFVKWLGVIFDESLDFENPESLRPGRRWVP